MEVLEQKLTDLSADVKAFAVKAKEEIQNLGAVQTETKSSLDTMRERMHAMQTQLDAVDAKTQHRHAPGGEEPKSLGQMFVESAGYKEAKEKGFGGRTRLCNFTMKSSAFPLERKTNITETNLGGATSGVLVQQRLPGLVPIAKQALRIRDLMTVVTQDSGNSFDFVQQATRTNVASPQVEASAKSQSYYNWSTASGSIRTIAHFIYVSRQALDDIPWLRSEIDSELTYGLKVKEEAEILSGDGTGVHLSGLSTQATAFDTNYLVAAAGWTRLDIVRYAKLQARLAGLATYAPNGLVLNPTDFAKLELTKSTYGEYIIGDPRMGGQVVSVPLVWNLPTVESDSIAVGTFLVGAFDTAATLIDRMTTSIDISFENQDNFEKNMATILCEERIGLAVKKAGAFITGTFNSSPSTT